MELCSYLQRRKSQCVFLPLSPQMPPLLFLPILPAAVSLVSNLHPALFLPPSSPRWGWSVHRSPPGEGTQHTASVFPSNGHHMLPFRWLCSWTSFLRLHSGSHTKLYVSPDVQCLPSFTLRTALAFLSCTIEACHSSGLPHSRFFSEIQVPLPSLPTGTEPHTRSWLCLCPFLSCGQRSCPRHLAYRRGW